MIMKSEIVNVGMGEAIADITHWASQRSLKGCHEEKGTILRWSRPHKQGYLEGLSTVCVCVAGVGGDICRGCG